MKKGFTLVELLAVIVILAILMVSAGTGIISTMNNSKMNIFKNEVQVFMDGAQRAYTMVSTTPSLYDNVKADSTDTYAGICISLVGLLKNGFIEKDISQYAGLFLIEVPYDGGQPAVTAWVHNGKYGVNGIGKLYINKVSFKKDNNTKKIKNDGNPNLYGADTVSGGPVGIVTNLKGIRLAIAKAYPEAGSVGVPSGIDQYKTTNIDSFTNRGGAGKTYNGIKCINDKL